MMTIRVTSLADIRALPWAGSIPADEPLYALVDDFIRAEPDLATRQEADRLASVCGMGEDFEIDPTYDPREYLGARR